MSSSTAVAKKSSSQQVAKPSVHDDSVAVESSEKEASASASGGLNLNVVGALSGAVSSVSNKFTSDSGEEIEEKHTATHASGKGIGSASGSGAAAAHAHDNKFKHIPQVEDKQ